MPTATIAYRPQVDDVGHILTLLGPTTHQLGGGIEFFLPNGFKSAPLLIDPNIARKWHRDATKLFNDDPRAAAKREFHKIREACRSFAWRCASKNGMRQFIGAFCQAVNGNSRNPRAV